MELIQGPIASSLSHLVENPTTAVPSGKLVKYLRVMVQMRGEMRRCGAQQRLIEMENMKADRGNGVTAAQIAHKILKG